MPWYVRKILREYVRFHQIAGLPIIKAEELPGSTLHKAGRVEL